MYQINISDKYYSFESVFKEYYTSQLFFAMKLLNSKPDAEDIVQDVLFLKGGSTIKVDLTNGDGLYVQHKPRPIIRQFNRLHYNPHRGWTIFSDIFAFSLIAITITGLIMPRGKNGLRGRGGDRVYNWNYDTVIVYSTGMKSV